MEAFSIETRVSASLPSSVTEMKTAKWKTIVKLTAMSSLIAECPRSKPYIRLLASPPRSAMR
jgi:hypothetical protein